MSLDKRLVKLEQTQVQDDPVQWLVETVTRNEHGEIVVVGRYQYVADKGLVKLSDSEKVVNEH